MSFTNIIRLADANVTSTNYFIDANVWIYAIQGDLGVLTHSWQERYSEFFYDIIESNLEPKPKILMPSLLFSEILNRYLRISFEEYKIENSIDENTQFRFKNEYRETDHYRENYEKICDDVIGYEGSIIFMSDSALIQNNSPSYLTGSIGTFDFNDFFYCQLCREYQKVNPVTILTNDGDFNINDIPIITSNRRLLSL